MYIAVKMSPVIEANGSINLFLMRVKIPIPIIINPSAIIIISGIRYVKLFVISIDHTWWLGMSLGEYYFHVLVGAHAWSSVKCMVCMLGAIRCSGKALPCTHHDVALGNDAHIHHCFLLRILARLIAIVHVATTTKL